MDIITKIKNFYKDFWSVPNNFITDLLRISFIVIFTEMFVNAYKNKNIINGELLMAFIGAIVGIIIYYIVIYFVFESITDLKNESFKKNEKHTF